MLRKLLSLMLVMTLLVLGAGCSSPKTEIQTKSSETPKAVEDNDTISIGYIAGSPTSPQPIINQKYSIIADELQKQGKKVNFISTRSLDKVWPLMDKEKGAPEFFYIPGGNFATYVTKTSRFGGNDDKYVIIAGSMNSNTTVLITKPSIKSLKDLDGKKIAIANNRYADEFQLNKLLSTVGLSTDTTGGTVQIIWDDIVPKLLENWGNGKYDAICLYAAENFPIALSKVKGSKILTTLNPNGLFGDKAPRYWLIARKDILKENPELVKGVLKAHILSTEKAIADKDSLPAINREIYLKYFMDQNVQMDDILKRNTLEEYQKRWKEVEITYDPNVGYVAELFDFLVKRGLVRKKNLDSFIQVDLLNEVLKEMGKPEIK